MIERYGGTVEKFIGDAVMAVWGAPTAHEDDAERAVRAALDLVDAVRGAGADRVATSQARAGSAHRRGGRDRRRRPGRAWSPATSSTPRPGSSRSPQPGHGAGRRGDASGGAATRSPSSLPGTTSSRARRARLGMARDARRGRARRGGAGPALEPPFVGRDEELRLLKELLHATGRERRARLVSVIGTGGHRQEPTGLGAREVRRRRRRDGLLAPGRSPVVRRGHHLLGARRDGPRGGPESPRDDEPTTRERSSPRRSREYVPDEDGAALDRAAPRVLLGLEEAPEAEREELFAAWRTFFERIADAGHDACSCSRICSGPTTACSTSSSHLLEWSRNGRSSSSRWPVRSFSSGGRTGAPDPWFTALRLEPLDHEAMAMLLRGPCPEYRSPVDQGVVERAGASRSTRSRPFGCWSTADS